MAHKWKIFNTTRKAQLAMLEDIKSAKVSIDLEQFIFELDDVGKEFLEVIVDKAKEGVKVRLLVDVGGSPDFFSSPLDDVLVSVGIELSFFNPITLWRLHRAASWYFRDHRKILIIDGTLGYTGGSGIYAKEWRDTNVRIEGPVIAQMQYAFDTMWTFANEGKFRRIKNLASSDQEFSFLTNSPRYKQRHFYNELLKRLSSAKERAWFSTPYFVPDLRFFRLLMQKARLGVDVRIILPAASDYPVVDRGGTSYFTLLLRSGVRIYQLPDFNHSKTFLIDNWTSVGSFNLDNISFSLAYEANLFSTNAKFRKELEKEFLTDLDSAREVVREEWLSRSFLNKIRELITWPIHRFL